MFTRVGIQMIDRDPSYPDGGSVGRLGSIEILPEYQLLFGTDVAATPGASVEADPAVEAKRTKMSWDCFDEVSRGNMGKFSLLHGPQQEHLYQEVAALAADPDVADAIKFGILTHDVFKKREVGATMGLPAEFDHDEGYRLLLVNPAYRAIREHYLPSYELLSETSQALVSGFAAIRSNYPQTLQGEAPAVTLEDLHNEPNPLVRDIDITIKKFDIFGARGHTNDSMSLTATPGTYRAMINLDAALRDPTLASPEERNNAFLDAEIMDFLGFVPTDEAALLNLRTIARLERNLRIETLEEFHLLQENFNGLPPTVRKILLTELSRSQRPTLAYYSPELVRTVTKQYGGQFALAYLAHVLQEAHIADQKARREGNQGIVTVQLDDVMRSMHRGEFDPAQTAIRFAPRGDALVAEPQPIRLEALDGLPEFNGESLREKRVLLIGEGGGSDGIQAAMVGELFAIKYGCTVAAVVSARNADRQVANAGRHIGQATKEITNTTEAVGDWRFLEKIPLEGDNPVPMYLLSASDPDVVKHDLALLIEETEAEVVIGVDTGGDSLYRSLHPSFSAHLPSDITPDHDYVTIESLASVAEEREDIKWLSVIVAPGVDSPEYAREVLEEIGAAQFNLNDDERRLIRRRYAEWRMDGSGSEEGRYGKTPLAWMHALEGNFGFRLLPLPESNVLSATNPWRAFTVITPAMAKIVVADTKRHFDAIKRQ